MLLETKESVVELTALSATELAARIRNGEVSAVEAIEAHIKRIEEVNAGLNAVVIPLFDQARQQARINFLQLVA